MKNDKLMITFKFQSKDKNDNSCNWNTFSIDKISASSIEKALKIIDNIKDMNNIDDAMVTMSGSYEYFRPMLEEMLEEMQEDANKSNRWREEDQDEISKGIISTVVEDVLNEFEFKDKNDKKMVRDGLRDYLAANPMYTKDLTSLVYKLIYEDNVLEMKEINSDTFFEICSSYPVYFILKNLTGERASELYNAVLSKEIAKQQENIISKRIEEIMINDVLKDFNFENEDNKKLIEKEIKYYIGANMMRIDVLTPLVYEEIKDNYSSDVEGIDDDVFFGLCAKYNSYRLFRDLTKKRASESYDSLLNEERERVHIANKVITVVVEHVLYLFEIERKEDMDLIKTDLKDYLTTKQTYVDDVASYLHERENEDICFSVAGMNEHILFKECHECDSFLKLNRLAEEKASELYNALTIKEKEKSIISKRIIETVIDDVFDEFKFEHEYNKKLIRHGLRDYLTANPMYVNDLTSLMYKWENGEYSSRLKEIDDDVFFETCASIHVYYDLKAFTREKASELYNNLLERRIEDSIRVKWDNFSCDQCGIQLENMEIYFAYDSQYKKEIFCSKECAIEFCKENDVIKL